MLWVWWRRSRPQHVMWKIWNRGIVNRKRLLCIPLLNFKWDFEVPELLDVGARLSDITLVSPVDIKRRSGRRGVHAVASSVNPAWISGMIFAFGSHACPSIFLHHCINLCIAAPLQLVTNFFLALIGQGHFLSYRRHWSIHHMHPEQMVWTIVGLLTHLLILCTLIHRKLSFVMCWTRYGEIHAPGVLGIAKPPLTRKCAPWFKNLLKRARWNFSLKEEYF